MMSSSPCVYDETDVIAAINEGTELSELPG